MDATRPNHHEARWRVASPSLTLKAQHAEGAVSRQKTLRMLIGRALD
jgi:hypothetical protein